MEAPVNPVLVGVVGAPHGIRGEVRVKPFTGDPLTLGDFAVLWTKSGRRLEILDLRFSKTMLIVRFLGVNSRDDAEALKGTELFIDRSMLDEGELEEGEFFHADLEGLEAYDLEGRFWGTVTGVFNFGGGDLLELTAEGGRPAVIPFTMAAVPDIDLENGRIIVEPVAAGLMDNDEPDGR